MARNETLGRYISCATNYAFKDRLLEGGTLYVFLADNQASCFTSDAVRSLQHRENCVAQASKLERCPACAQTESCDTWKPMITVMFADSSERTGAVVLDNDYNVLGILDGDEFIRLPA